MKAIVWCQSFHDLNASLHLWLFASCLSSQFVKQLREAREIVLRLRKRQLYKFVDEFNMPGELKQVIRRDDITAERIVRCADGLKVTMTSCDINHVNIS